MKKYQTNSLTKYKSKKLTSPSIKHSLIKVHRVNSKIINPISYNLNKKTIDQCISKVKIFSESKKNKKFNSNTFSKKKIFQKEKKNIINKKKVIKNHNKSVIIKKQDKVNTINASKRNIKNSIKVDCKNQRKINEKNKQNSPVCHLYYCTKNIQCENIDYNTIQNTHSGYLAAHNTMQYKSKKINNSGSTALSFSESCINNPISGKTEFSVDTVISSTTAPFGLYLMDDSLNANINNKKIDKNISDTKVTLNKKNDTSLLTFGNSYNDSAKKSYDSSTKKYINSLKKENEFLKCQLNKKNEKINILQQKIETLLLNDSENDYLKIDLINDLKNLEKDFPNQVISGINQIDNNNKIIKNKNKNQHINIINDKHVYSSQNENIMVIKRMKSCYKNIQNDYKKK